MGLEKLNSGQMLFVSPSFYVLSGMATWLDYLLPGLEARGWQPVLGLVSGPHHDVDRYLDAHPWPKTVRISNPTGSAEGRIRAVEQAIRELAPDLVVSVNIPACYAAVERLRHRCGVYDAPRVVMANHSLEPHYLADAEAWSHVLDGLIGTNRLIACMADQYTRLDSRRLHYAPCGTEPGPILQDEEAATRASRLLIGYSGRLEVDQKRVQDLGPILATLDALGVAYEFRVAGSGPYEQQVRDELSKGVGAGRVRFMGHLNPGELNQELYGWADALLVTSYWETGPLVIWEAMAHRVAVVSSRYIGAGCEGALRHEENCLLFPVGDAGEAARQLARLVDVRLRGHLTDAGYALVTERYTHERSVEAWDRACRAILSLPIPDQGERRTPVPAAGRLDALLGTALAETLRRALGVSFRHAGPGGEWPHATGGQPIDTDAYWEQARRLDRAVGEANPCKRQPVVR